MLISQHVISFNMSLIFIRKFFEYNIFRVILSHFNFYRSLHIFYINLEFDYQDILLTLNIKTYKNSQIFAKGK